MMVIQEKPEHLTYVKTLERLGVSAIIIEDKIGLKKNSLNLINNKIQLKVFVIKFKLHAQNN